MELSGAREIDAGPQSTGPGPTPILIGLRGSGKTTIGRKLALRLGRRFVDLDDRTPRFAGAKSVGEALRTLGEPAFRQAEARALFAALDEPGVVLALGGGTPTAPGAAERLRHAKSCDQAVVMYLRADADALRSRLEQDKATDRPALMGNSALDEIPQLLAARDPLYRALADHIIEVARSDAETLARFIAQKLA
jgi:shikimate kinase